MHAGDFLVQSCETTKSIACVGLDPRPELVPSKFAQNAIAKSSDPRQQVAIAFATYLGELIDALANHCAAFKFQVACFEAYGSLGWQTLEQVVAKTQSHAVPVIVDAKRADIGSSASHYRQGLLTSAAGLDGVPLPGLSANWLTTNPYLGEDSVASLLGTPDEGKGVFVLVRTSNRGAQDFQDQMIGDVTLAELVAKKVHSWGVKRRGKSGFSDVGAVVGATWPKQAKVLRQLMPHTLMLVPGFGAQGADADQAVAGCTDQGNGILVNSSRAILGAWQTHSDNSDPIEAARSALDTMNEQLNSALP